MQSGTWPLPARHLLAAAPASCSASRRPRIAPYAQCATKVMPQRSHVRAAAPRASREMLQPPPARAQLQLQARPQIPHTARSCARPEGPQRAPQRQRPTDLRPSSRVFAPRRSRPAAAPQVSSSIGSATVDSSGMPPPPPPNLVHPPFDVEIPLEVFVCHYLC